VLQAIHLPKAAPLQQRSSAGCQTTLCIGGYTTSETVWLIARRKSIREKIDYFHKNVWFSRKFDWSFPTAFTRS